MTAPNAGEEHIDDEEEDEYDDYDDEHEEEEEEEHEEEEHEGDDGAAPVPPSGEEKKYDEETQALIDIADKARRTFDEASNRLRDLERELRDLKEVSEGDFGDENEFLPMKGQCFEFKNNEYVYKMCPFDRCSQRGINGGGETRLGKWDRWDGPVHDTFSR